MYNPTQNQKQFDSDPNLTRPGQQQKSANELVTMKNDNSELIVRKTCLISGQPSNAVSTEQIILKHERASATAENENPNVGGGAPLMDRITGIFEAKSERKERRSEATVGEHESSIDIVMGAKTVEEEGARTESRASDGGAAKGATADLQESVRRSLERVESIKNLLIHSDTRNEFDHSAVHAEKPDKSDENIDDEICCIVDKHKDLPAE